MTTKAIKQQIPNALQVVRRPAETEAQALAHMPLRTDVLAALTIDDYSKRFGAMDVNTLVDDLRKQCAQVNAGNLAHAEDTLVAQAATLDAMFNSLARRAFAQEQLPQYEAHMRFALRAQSQCRATLETLATIKNPPVFAKQANIAHGPQQVNNGVACEPTREEEKANPPTELLEHDHGQRLDTRTTRAAGASNPIMATVGTRDGATHRTRKGRSKP